LWRQATKQNYLSTTLNYSYTGLWRIAANFTEHCGSYHIHNVTPHDAVVVVVSEGAPRQIDASLRIESKNGTTVHTTASRLQTLQLQ
jgi:hypothetical protein